MLTFPIPFTPEMDWSAPLLETLEHETTIVPFTGGQEQREALMETPHRRLSFLVTAGDVQEANLAEALAYGGQSYQFWAPYWRGVSWLSSALSIGATALTTPTAYQGFEIGQGVMFLRSPTIAEVAVLTDVDDTGIEFEALTKSWAASGSLRARVVPVYRSLLAPSVDFDYVERSIKTVRVTFDVLPDAE